jgi:hypothetical protein
VVLAIVAWAIGLACILVSFRYFQKSAPDDTEAVLRTLRRTGRIESEPGVASAAGSPAADVARSVLRAPDRQHAELNEQLTAQERSLSVGAELPQASARIALATGTLLAIVELARTLPGGGPTLWPVYAFGGGFIAAGVALMLGRAAKKRLDRRRQAWNHLARVLIGRFDRG